MHENLGVGLVALIEFLNDPRNDANLLSEAKVDIDPILLPLLVRLERGGSAGVVDLAAQLGRDHSTMSRQLDKLAMLGLAERSAASTDRRSRITHLTPRGIGVVTALSEARLRLLNQALTDWSLADREALARLIPRFAEALQTGRERAATNA